MYELTCPSCRAVRTSPFVRVNAVTRCPACGHVGRISPGHFERVAPAAAGVGPDAGAPAPSDAAKAAAPPADTDSDTDQAEPALDQDAPPADPLGGSSVTGLSGLTEIMQSEPGAPASMPRKTMPPLQEARLSPSARPTPTPVSPRVRRVALLAIGVLALIIAVAGLLVVLVADDPRSETEAPAARPLAPTADPSGQEPIADPSAEPGGDR